MFRGSKLIKDDFLTKAICKNCLMRIIFWKRPAKQINSFTTHFSDLWTIFLMPSWVNTLPSTFESEICLRFSSRPREKSYPRLSSSFLLDAGDWLRAGETFPIAVSAFSLFLLPNHAVSPKATRLLPRPSVDCLVICGGATRVCGSIVPNRVASTG